MEEKHRMRPSIRKLVELFIECEAEEFSTRTKEILLSKKDEIISFIEENGVDHVTLNSLTNMGQLTRSLTIDRFSSEKWQLGDINITFCSCGHSWSATQERVTWEHKEGAESKRTVETIILKSSDCEMSNDY